MLCRPLKFKALLYSICLSSVQLVVASLRKKVCTCLAYATALRHSKADAFYTKKTPSKTPCNAKMRDFVMITSLKSEIDDLDHHACGNLLGPVVRWLPTLGMLEPDALETGRLLSL